MKRTLVKSFIAIFIALVFLEAGFLIASRGQTDLAQIVHSSAKTILKACKDRPYHGTCYEETIPGLLEELSVDQVFSVIRLVMKQDSTYAFCHVLAHELGVRKVAKNPVNWMNVIPYNPKDGLCSNGFIHGAALERFRTEILTEQEIDMAIPDLKIACEERAEWKPTELDRAICYHGLGHLAAYLTEARVQKSIGICKEIAVKEDGRDYTTLCVEGIFMQFFQPLEPEDLALIDKLEMKPNKENLADFCARYSANIREEGACWREGWALYRDELNTAEGIVAFCQKSPLNQQDQCFNSVLSVKGRGSISDPEAMEKICNNLPSQLQGKCFGIGSSTILEENRGDIKKSTAFCLLAKEEQVVRSCYNHLILTASTAFLQRSKGAKAFCDALPHPWQQECLKKTSTY